MVYAVLLCAVAAFSTAFGGIIIALFPNMSKKSLCISQGFAAGVMLGISFMDMLPKSYENFCGTYNNFLSSVLLLGCFILGWILALLMAKTADVKSNDNEDEELAKAKRACLITTAVIILHNLPEGMLTCFSGLGDTEFGLHMAFAVALHNIPEGMAVASSVLYISSSKIKAVAQSFAAGAAEFAGGVAALVIMHRFITPQLLSAVIAIISGVMIQVSVCELIPNAAKMHSAKMVFKGVLVGVIVIAIGMFVI